MTALSNPHYSGFHKAIEEEGSQHLEKRFGGERNVDISIQYVTACTGCIFDQKYQSFAYNAMTRFFSREMSNSSCD